MYIWSYYFWIFAPSVQSEFCKLVTWKFSKLGIPDLMRKILQISRALPMEIYGNMVFWKFIIYVSYLCLDIIWNLHLWFFFFLHWFVELVSLFLSTYLENKWAFAVSWNWHSKRCRKLACHWGTPAHIRSGMWHWKLNVLPSNINHVFSFTCVELKVYKFSHSCF